MLFITTHVMPDSVSIFLKGPQCHMVAMPLIQKGLYIWIPTSAFLYLLLQKGYICLSSKRNTIMFSQKGFYTCYLKKVYIPVTH